MSFIVKTQWPLSLEFEILMQMLAAKGLEGGGEGPREETTPLISIVSHFYSMLSWFFSPIKWGKYLHLPMSAGVL